jgi:transcriptional regulator with XRE-family HTH domain
MAHRERPRDRGTRRARRLLAELGRELREARLGAGLRQADVARAARVSSSWVSRVELGQAAEVGMRKLTVMLAIVGLDLAARAYPVADPLRDDGQRRLLARFRTLLPAHAP